MGRYISQIVFPCDLFNEKINKVVVIGAGKLGVRVVRELASYGIRNIEVYDDARIEAQHTATHLFDAADVGRFKVDCLQEIVEKQTGIKITVHREKHDGSQEVGGVTFILTDDLESKKKIWNRAIRYQGACQVMVEARLGTTEGRVYLVKPCEPKHVRGWEASCCFDTDSQGTAQGCADRADILAGHTVQQMITWARITFNKQRERQDDGLILIFYGRVDILRDNFWF